VLDEISSDEKAVKGEFVLVIEGKAKEEDQVFLNREQEKVLEILMKTMKKNDALSLASKSFGLKKNSLYKLTLKRK
jgi:16S rRNA C1402 (ribose-2'-O) methylase RsmI